MKSTTVRRSAALAAITITALTAACTRAASPQDTASALLTQAGATATGTAYLVTAGDGASCDPGSAEADGTIGSQLVTVCVFPSASLRNQDAALWLFADTRGNGQLSPSAVMTGTALVYLIGAPAPLISQVAALVSGAAV